ncbi:SDR family oxidoreductase [Xanthomonas sp. AmX2]|uniref:oxidoreductase n=1 Tax=Xanthomonas sp. TaxID=29446 RepID=UPI00197E49B5|nr:oxidoreductase [Xanthomonas sp.]MBN6150258.1 SDR family oxidoreductase [Xanthomonas sp.]
MAHWTATGTPSRRARDAAGTDTASYGPTARPLSRWRTGFAALGALLLSACAAGGSIAQGQPKPDWSLADMPSQEGRIFLVTGGTSGIGYESAKALAAAGAHVVIAARSAPARGEEALARIRQEMPDAQVQYQRFDLADLASVRALAEHLNATLPRLDGLINNAGIMEPPQRGTSKDGFETQFAINYLGHFALTDALLPLLRKSDSPRVVTLSSIAARLGAIHFDDLQFERGYDPGDAYQQSKLACLMFALELQRRSDAAGWGIQSSASHPGVSRTNLQVNNGFVRRSLGRLILQPAARGALPTLYAATAPDARGGRYYGPTGVMEMRGPLGFAELPAAATDAQAAIRLWAVSEQLSGARYPSRLAD